MQNYCVIWLNINKFLKIYHHSQDKFLTYIYTVDCYFYYICLQLPAPCPICWLTHPLPSMLETWSPSAARFRVGILNPSSASTLAQKSWVTAPWVQPQQPLWPLLPTTERCWCVRLSTLLWTSLNSRLACWKFYVSKSDWVSSECWFQNMICCSHNYVSASGILLWCIKFSVFSNKKYMFLFFY